MLWHPPIVLAADDATSLLDVVIWGIAVVFWIVFQFKVSRQKQKRPPARPAADPTQQELLDVFRRLGADIPGTPPPPVAPPPKPAPVAPSRPRATAMPTPQMAPRATLRKAAPAKATALAAAERHARAREADILAIADAIGAAGATGLATRVDDAPAMAAATRHSQVILPRLHAMDLRLLRLPAIVLPGADRTHQVGKPLRMRLHSRREIRDALVVQNILRPAKALAP